MYQVESLTQRYKVNSNVSRHEESLHKKCKRLDVELNVFDFTYQVNIIE